MSLGEAQQQEEEGEGEEGGEQLEEEEEGAASNQHPGTGMAHDDSKFLVLNWKRH